MKIGEFWKMLKFHNIPRVDTIDIFLWKNITSLKKLKFHMHGFDDDSDMFCKFDEILWILIGGLVLDAYL